MSILILPIAILLGYAVLPAAWGLRAWTATGVLVIWGYCLAPETPFQNEGPLDGLGAALLTWLFILASLGVGSRAFWALANGRSLQTVPPAHSTLYRADYLLASLFGLVTGAGITLLLAVYLRGMSGGLPLHLAVAGLAAGLAIAAVWLPGRARPLAVTTFACMACLTLAGGILYPGLIQSKAEIIHPDAPRCLRTPDGVAPTADQLRLLTLPKAQSRRPNLVLTVMTDTGPQDFRWSYRSFAFRTYGSYIGGLCPT